jgi:hypothetical protein
MRTRTNLAILLFRRRTRRKWEAMYFLIWQEQAVLYHHANGATYVAIKTSVHHFFCQSKYSGRRAKINYEVCCYCEYQQVVCYGFV